MGTFKVVKNHGSTHPNGGSTDVIDGDKLDITFAPSNYTPATDGTNATATTHLAAHLIGINTAIGNMGNTEFSILDHTDHNYVLSTFERALVDTSGASQTTTIKLPASPSVGDWVIIGDAKNSFSSHYVEMDRNGSNLRGSAANNTFTASKKYTVFIYVGSTFGWNWWNFFSED